MLLEIFSSIIYSIIVWKGSCCLFPSRWPRWWQDWTCVYRFQRDLITLLTFGSIGWETPVLLLLMTCFPNASGEERRVFPAHHLQITFSPSPTARVRRVMSIIVGHTTGWDDSSRSLVSVLANHPAVLFYGPFRDNSGLRSFTYIPSGQEEPFAQAVMGQADAYVRRLVLVWYIAECWDMLILCISLKNKNVFIYR